jgi:hypothetical protein
MAAIVALLLAALWVFGSIFIWSAINRKSSEMHMLTTILFGAIGFIAVALLIRSIPTNNPSRLDVPLTRPHPDTRLPFETRQ